MSTPKKHNKPEITGEPGSVPLAGAIALGIHEAAALAGVSRSTLYELIGSGELRAIKLLGRRLILKADLEDLFARLKAQAEAGDR